MDPHSILEGIRDGSYFSTVQRVKTHSDAELVQECQAVQESSQIGVTVMTAADGYRHAILTLLGRSNRRFLMLAGNSKRCSILRGLKSATSKCLTMLFPLKKFLREFDMVGLHVEFRF
jgi:hypothetical protein